MDQLSHSHKNDILVIINDYFLEMGGGGCVLCFIAPLINSRLSAVVGRLVTISDILRQGVDSLAQLIIRDYLPCLEGWVGRSHDA